MKYMSKNPFIVMLWIFIFKEGRRESHNANDLTEMRKKFESKGNLFLESRLRDIDCTNLLVYVTGAIYDARL